MGLVKPDGDVRPIGYGCLLRRLAGKLQVQLNAQPLQTLFSGANQFGSNVDNGAEVAVHVMKVARDHCRFDPRRCIFKFDIANAFNTLERLALRNATAEALSMDLPGVGNLVSQLHNIDAKMWEHSRLLYGDGGLRSMRGTIQGDPAAAQEFDIPLVLRVLRPLLDRPSYEPSFKMMVTSATLTPKWPALPFPALPCLVPLVSHSSLRSAKYTPSIPAKRALRCYQFLRRVASEESSSFR
jgi:hypothetical protein